MKRNIIGLILLSTFAFCINVCCTNEDDNGPQTQQEPTGNNTSEEPTEFDTIVFKVEDPNYTTTGMVYNVSINIHDKDLRLDTLRIDGKSYSFGICYVPIAEGNRYPVFYEQEQMTPGTPEFSTTNFHEGDSSASYGFSKILRKDNVPKVARIYIYMNDGKMHYSDPIYINPIEESNPNISITTPELVSSSKSTLKVGFSYSGLTEEEINACFINLIYCPASDGIPNSWTSETEVVTSTYDIEGMQTQGECNYTITGLHSGTTYNVAAVIERNGAFPLVISEYSSFTTQNY